MHESLQAIEFPVVAFARGGWKKEALDIGELTEVFSHDGFEELLGLEIYDSVGQFYVVEKVWRAWPKSSVGALFCKFLNHGFCADFKLSAPVPIALEELKEKLRLHYPDCVFAEARTHRELIEML